MDEPLLVASRLLGEEHGVNAKPSMRTSHEGIERMRGRRVWLPAKGLRTNGGFVTPDYEVAQQQQNSSFYVFRLSLSLLDAVAPPGCSCTTTEFEYPVQEPSSQAILKATWKTGNGIKYEEVWYIIIWGVIVLLLYSG
jgi:hypothetical protein